MKHHLNELKEKINYTADDVILRLFGNGNYKPILNAYDIFASSMDKGSLIRRSLIDPCNNDVLIEEPGTYPQFADNSIVLWERIEKNPPSTIGKVGKGLVIAAIGLGLSGIPALAMEPFNIPSSEKVSVVYYDTPSTYTGKHIQSDPPPAMQSIKDKIILKDKEPGGDKIFTFNLNVKPTSEPEMVPLQYLTLSNSKALPDLPTVYVKEQIGSFVYEKGPYVLGLKVGSEIYVPTGLSYEDHSEGSWYKGYQYVSPMEACCKGICYKQLPLDQPFAVALGNPEPAPLEKIN